MLGLSALRNVWVILIVAALPVLITGIAAAAPGYPVEDPPGNTYAVAYSPSDHVLTVTDTTPTSIAAVTPSTVVDEVSSDVTGPNGQINHGQIVSELHNLIDGKDVGCITRAVAQSDLGKGDQQVRPNDPTVELPTIDLDPTVLEVECPDHGKPTEPTAKSDPKPAKAQSDSPGKSDSASGKNK